MPGQHEQLLLRQLGGAIARRPHHSTAYSFRASRSLLTVVGSWDIGSSDPAAHTAWARSTWQDLRHISSGGSYVNQLDDDERTDRVREAYGDPTWRRLVQLKSRMDPTNVFWLNQNVPPDVTG
jgi:FAD/FMN-containing dehydrogenase